MSAPYACVITPAGATCGYCNELVLAADELGHTLLYHIEFTYSPAEWWCRWYSLVFKRVIHQCPPPVTEEEVAVLALERELEGAR